MSYNLVCVLSFGKCLKSFCRICVFNCVAFNVCCREKSPHQVKVVSFLSLSHPALLSSNPVLLPPHHLLCIIWGALPKHKFGQFICVQLHQHQMARWYTWHKKSPEPEKVNLLEACWLRGFCLTCTCSHLATSFRTTTLLIIVAMDFWGHQKAITNVQLIQNSAARVLTKTKWTADITPVLKSLLVATKPQNCLKVLLLIYKSLHGVGPKYMTWYAWAIQLCETS